MKPVQVDHGARIVRVKPQPIDSGALGHYRTVHRTVLLPSQAVASRIFELRNAHASHLIVLTRLGIRWVQTANHTATIDDSLDCYKLSDFSAVDTTNTYTPGAVVKRATMAAPPGGVLLRGLQQAGLAAGMTGGTMTEDTAGPFAQVGLQLLQTLPAGSWFVDKDLIADSGLGGYPFVFGPNEGFKIQNRAVLGVAAGSAVYIDCEWAEVTSYP